MESHPVTFDALLERLAALLRSEGVRVELHSPHLPEGVAGSFTSPEDNEDSTPTHPAPPAIEINEPSIPLALLTLAHEAGHYRAWRKGEQPPLAVDRERLARKYGLRELRRIGIRLKPGVWARFHETMNADGRYIYQDEGPDILAT